MGVSVHKGLHTGDLAADPRWQLVERIASSPAFQKSARLRDLLLFVTERSLHGHSEELTEQKIGHAVFGRPTDYSPLEDSSVRVHMRQLRLRLHEYFDSVGRSEPLVMEIPKGSYVPVFHNVESTKGTHPNPMQSGRVIGFLASAPVAWLLCGLLALSCALLIFRLDAARRTPLPPSQTSPPWPLSQVFDCQRHTTIVVADVNYGMLRIIAHKRGSVEEYLAPDFPKQFISPNLIGGMMPIVNYVSDSLLTSFADVATVAAFLQLAGPCRDRVSVRSARDLKPRDLDEGNFVFLGSPGSNPWVQLFENRLNFVETENRVGTGPKAFLNKTPKPGEEKTYEGLRWTGTAGEDYADIALLRNAEPKGSILILQGLQQEGTEAAGRFLSDPIKLRALRESLGVPLNPNPLLGFEALIRTRAVAGAPNSESIVATRLIH
ncbi:MAG TPA: hypothetical protein VFD30_08985 [Terriglobia bacterium]|jgi:hypothetical protein|nr:hypothetical protein [Terriglobia bacterium]